MAIHPRFVLMMSIGLACACASTPKPEDASKTDGETTAGSSEPGETSTVDLNDTSTPQSMPTGVKRTTVDGAPDNTVPDDYSLVENDCVQLGKKLGSLWATDLRSTLSPKLNEKQRAAAEENIRDGSDKKANDWADGCVKSLVGKVVDRNVLKCAFDSKDLKSFEKCLN